MGFFIPIVGLILFLIYEGKKPKRAKSAGKGALIGFITKIVLSIILAILYVVFAATLFTNISNDIESNILAIGDTFREETTDEILEKLHIHQEENKDRLATLDQLPDNCAASAERLEQQRAIFEAHHVFSPSMIDGIIKKLRSYKDRTLRADIGDDSEKMLALVEKYFHCG